MGEKNVWFEPLQDYFLKLAFKPWSFHEYCSRLNSFVDYQWTERPDEIEAFYYATRGWNACDTNTVECKICKNTLYLPWIIADNFVEEVSSHFSNNSNSIKRYKDLAISGHKNSCSWVHFREQEDLKLAPLKDLLSKYDENIHEYSIFGWIQDHDTFTCSFGCFSINKNIFESPELEHYRFCPWIWPKKGSGHQKLKDYLENHRFNKQ